MRCERIDQAHLRLLDALDGEAAELAVHLSAVVGGGRDGGRADALVVLGRVLPDQLVGVRLQGGLMFYCQTI